MKLALCPTCRTIHEAVSPAGLSRLSKDIVRKRLTCALCTTPSMSFRQTAEAPDTPPGEIGYPAAIVPMFEFGFAQWRDASPGDLDLCTEYGLPWRAVSKLLTALEIEGEVLSDWLGLTWEQVQVAMRAGQSMDPTQAGLCLFIAHMIGQVEDIARRTGKPNATRPGLWLGQWLQQPNEDLQGREPSEFLSTFSRRQLLVDFIGSMESSSDRDARVTQLEELLVGVALKGLEDASAGRIMSYEELNRLLAAAVPKEFPRAGEASLAGAQPKLAARRINGKFVVGETDEERRGRYDACLALVEFLVLYVRRKQAELPKIGRADLLAEVRKGLEARNLGFDAQDLDWVMQRVASSP